MHNFVVTSIAHYERSFFMLFIVLCLADVAFVGELVHHLAIGICFRFRWLRNIYDFMDFFRLECVEYLQLGYGHFAQWAYVGVLRPSVDAVHAEDVLASCRLCPLTDVLEADRAFMLVLLLFLLFVGLVVDELRFTFIL